MINKRIILIGAGNVAHHLAPALLKSGMNLCQIYSRSIESARELGEKTGITYTSDIFAIYPDGDIYIFCVSDDVMFALYKSIRINKKAIVLHTSGSLPMDIFKPYSAHCGVLYPLQSFTKKRDLDFREIPLCIEASDTKVMQVLREMAGILSIRVEEISSEKRKYLHLAAVLANNFVNYFYGIAGNLLEKEGLDFSLLRPLIFETAHKVMLMSPENAQTGPAKRGDEGILNVHKDLLKDNQKLLNLYTQMSDLIRESVVKQAELKTETDDKPEMLSLW
ncbi:MAG: DUF2520 domain-containing protein [Odoribacter sp.]